MNKSWLPLLLVISGNVLYHISQKSVPKNISPLWMIILAYAVGIVICLCSFFALPANQSVGAFVSQLNWSVLGIGSGAAAVEIGLLLAYRSGWNLGITSIVISAATASILIPVSLLFFRESLTLRHLLGAACCLLGLILISKK
jgi:drug/metabolite transporter (DMT)-like permease